MKQVNPLLGLLGLLCIVALSGCGGGGSVASSTPAQNSFSGGGNNVVTMTVQAGPAGAMFQPFNQPYVSVKICAPNGGACGTISGVLVDTGSYGLRIMASALSAAGVTLTGMPDPSVAGNTIQECTPFADGYAWGQVSLADIGIGGETSNGTVSVQVINDSSTPPSNVPSTCTSDGKALDGVDQLGANGILGVGVLASDCGSYCAQDPALQNQGYVYYSCPNSGSCSPTSLPEADQVNNPVAYFPVDNNGVILQLPSVSSAGAPTAAGYLVFGIGTESNNGLGAAKVITANDMGNFTTQFGGTMLQSSFIDSGSNALFFNDSSLDGSECFQNSFYCPPSITNLSATNEGANGATSDVSFSIVDLSKVDTSNFALADVGGPAPSANGLMGYFDWGIPFFYGRTVYIGLQGVNAGGTTGPYYAY